MCRAPTAHLLYLLSVATHASACPAGYMGTGVAGSKCMRLTAPATHEACATACGSDGALACIQSEADKAVADMVQLTAAGGTPDMGAFVWTGGIHTATRTPD